ncbi:unnamed protein product, partial [Rotaria sp. Silwood1]
MTSNMSKQTDENLESLSLI